MREIRLPTDCDLSIGSVQWAARLMAQIDDFRRCEHTPMRLEISSEDRAYAGEHIADIEVVVDPALSRFSWRLVGPHISVFSSGG